MFVSCTCTYFLLPVVDANRLGGGLFLAPASTTFSRLQMQSGWVHACFLLLHQLPSPGCRCNPIRCMLVHCSYMLFLSPVVDATRLGGCFRIAPTCFPFANCSCKPVGRMFVSCTCTYFLLPVVDAKRLDGGLFHASVAIEAAGLF